MSSPFNLSSKVLIIGSGFSGLVQAKVLKEDGFANVHLVSASSIGGTWASDDTGSIYPGLLTNSAHGGFDLSGLEMPADDLDQTWGRLKAETITTYLAQYYDLFVKDRVDVRTGLKVVNLSRPPSGNGWRVQMQEIATGYESIEQYDKVVLAHGCHSKPHTPEMFKTTPESFKGIIVHSSKLHGKVYEEIINKSGPIVVVGGGKSATDIAAYLAGMGKEVVSVFRKLRAFVPLEKPEVDKADHLVLTRLFSTLAPPEHIKTWMDWLLHQTRPGAWFVGRTVNRMDEEATKKLTVDEDSIMLKGRPSILWRGPDGFGGRIATDDDSYHGLVKSGKIKVKGQVSPERFLEDGSGLLLDDGSEIKAATIILATGFASPFDFISLDERVRLGIEHVPPFRTPAVSPVASYPIFANPPGPPSNAPASHIYQGIVPAGALESRDLALNGFVFLIRAPYTAELSAHWISSFFMGDPNLHLPSTNDEAAERAEDHANWLRYRFPLSEIPWDTHSHVAMINAQHYNDSLIEDLSLPLRQEKAGWVSYYTGRLSTEGLATLGEERKALREGRALHPQSWLDWLFFWVGVGGEKKETKKDI